MARAFENSHPWISFRFDLGRISPLDSFRLGEAMSKCQHLAGAPLMPEVSRELHLIYLVKGARATTAIEGNTLTEEEVRDRVEGKGDLPPSREYQGVAVDNIIEVCNEILLDVFAGAPVRLSVELIKEFNRRVLERQELDDKTKPGEFRLHSVVVGGYRGAPSEDIDFLMAKLCDWLNDDWINPDQFPNGVPRELKFTVSVVKAILGHLYLAWIHPFGDGNGRTARLVEFLLLVTQGVPSPAAHLLSNHYNLTRDRYYRELDRSSKTDVGPYPFMSYALEGFVDGLREQVDQVRRQQVEVTWRNYVHAHFQQQKGTETQRRRRELVLSMPRDRPSAKTDIPELTPRLARLYATKGLKTLTRDVNALVNDGLVRRSGEGYLPAIEVVEAFLPVRADVE